MSNLETVTDALGRKITFKNIGVLEQAKISRILGRDHPNDAMNMVLMQMAQTACSVTDIDGTPRPFPTNSAYIYAAMDVLGDEGFAAVMAVLKKRMDSLTADAEKAAMEDAAKNSAATPDSLNPAG